MRCGSLDELALENCIFLTEADLKAVVLILFELVRAELPVLGLENGGPLLLVESYLQWALRHFEVISSCVFSCLCEVIGVNSMGNPIDLFINELVVDEIVEIHIFPPLDIASCDVGIDTTPITTPITPSWIVHECPECFDDPVLA